MLVSMERLLAIRTLASKYGWNQRETEANAKLLDMALEPAHARMIATYDADIEKTQHDETQWEKDWNAATPGDQIERRRVACENFENPPKRGRQRKDNEA